MFALERANDTGIESSRFDPAAPDAYELVEKGDWLNYLHSSSDIPSQGWKIHLSCDLGTSEEMLRVVKHYLFEHCFSFKHIRSKAELETRNSRRIDGQLFGKFITVYPTTLAEAEKASSDLSILTEGYSGPRILTDIQVGNSVVHLRYGTFVPQERINPETGYSQEYLWSPDGEVEWVERKATFELPTWAPRSRWIDQLIEDYKSKDIILPFSNVAPLRKTSRGSIFAADYLGQRSFIKEGRKRSELDQQGKDTVDRFHCEKQTLEKLKEIKAVPRFYDSIDAGSSVFFAMEYLEGDSLNSLIVKEMGRPYSHIETKSYIAQLNSIFSQVSQTLEKVHAVGVFHYDLSPGNILVGKDGSVYIVDWESSVDDAEAPRNIFTPGFSAPASVKGKEVDYFSLSRIAAFALSAHGPILDIFPENIAIFPSYIESLFGEDGLRFFEQYVDFDQESTISKSPFLAPPPIITSELLQQGIKELSQWGGPTRFAVESGHDLFAYGGGLGSYLCSLRLRGKPDKKWEAIWHKESLPPDNLSLWSGLSGYVLTSLTLGKSLDVCFINTFVSRLIEEIKEGAVRDASLTNGIGGWIIALEAIILHTDTSLVPQLSILREVLTSHLQELVRSPSLAQSYEPGLLRGWSGTICAILAAPRFFAGFDPSTLLKTMIDKEEEKLEEDSNGNLQVAVDMKFLPYLGTGSAGVIWARDSMRDAGFFIGREAVDEKISETLLPGVFALPSLMKGAAGLKLLAKRREYLGISGPSPESYDQEIAISSGLLGAGAVVVGEDPRSISSSFCNGAAGIMWAESITPKGPVDFLPTTLLGRSWA